MNNNLILVDYHVIPTQVNGYKPWINAHDEKAYHVIDKYTDKWGEYLYFLVADIESGKIKEIEFEQEEWHR